MNTEITPELYFLIKLKRLLRSVKDKNSDKFLCRRFKSLMKQLTDVSRIILGINNERLTGCYCTKALAARGKCVPC